MAFLIGLLTLVMVADCLILVFLVLIQLPKKDAGAGLAFGSGATDALFGAGSGTVLTKITKYSATTFFVLAIVLSVMQMNYHRRTSSEFEKNLEKQGPPPAAAVAPSQPLAPAAAPATTTNTPFLSTTAAELTNQPPVQTNAATTNLTIPAPTPVPAPQK
jgi:preprotein translocase subunit SecG